MSSPREEKEVDIAKIEEFKGSVELGDFKRAIELLNEGVDINTIVRSGVNILMVVCSKDKPEIVEQLLVRRAAIDARDINGRSAVHFAAQRELFKITYRT